MQKVHGHVLETRDACDGKEEKEKYNEELISKLKEIKDGKLQNKFLKALDILWEVGVTRIPQIHAKRDERGISDQLYNLVLKRGRHLGRGELEKVKETDGEIRKQRRFLATNF